MTLKLPVKESNRLHMVIASEIKEGLDLTLIADATKSQSTGESNPAVKVTQMLEYVKEIKDFTKRIPIELLSDTNTNFKEKMFGKITVVNKPKTAGNVESLNTLWHSLSEAYPEWFSAETLSDNMPIEMLRVMDELKPQSVGAEEFFMQSNDEIAIELASRVVEGEKCA